MCFFPFPALVFPKNREIPGNSREVIFGNSQTGTTLVIYLTVPFIIGLLWQIVFHFNGLTRIIALFALFFTSIFNYTMFWMASSICFINKVIVKLLYPIQFDKTHNTRLFHQIHQTVILQIYTRHNYHLFSSQLLVNNYTILFVII